MGAKSRIEELGVFFSLYVRGENGILDDSLEDTYMLVVQREQIIVRGFWQDTCIVS